MTDRDELPQLNRSKPVDFDEYTDIRLALEDYGAPYKRTPYGAQKTAELDVQFAIDPSYGLSKQRFGWYSNDTLFDSTFFSEENGKITIETGSTSGDIARLRSAFAGQYLPHSVAEPGLGARIPSQHIETDSDGYVSLTHGEISLDIAQWSDTDDRAIESFGISYESDATYFQLRTGDENTEFVKQENWNIDPMDGTGRSGAQLQPSVGYVYLMRFSWYGEGSYILALQDPREDNVIPVHRYPPTEGGDALSSPNMPVTVTVENKNTADPLSCVVGGMQFTTHGGNRDDREVTRLTQESRLTSTSYIDTEVVLSGESVSPYDEPGRPLVAIRRDENDIRARKGLKMELAELYANISSDCYLFVFDEYSAETALTGQNFSPPKTKNTGIETRVETDTEATDYTPTKAVLRGVSYIESGGTSKATEDIIGNTNTNVPLESTIIVTAALAPGSNNAGAEPALVGVREKF